MQPLGAAPSLAAAGLSIMASAGCSIPVYQLPITRCPTARVEPGTEHVSVQFLGVGGVLLSHAGGDVVLTAPLYTNPSLVEYLLDHEMRPDTDLIDALLPEEAREAQAILVGHSHYDHLLDVPYVALHKATQADVYGSTTTKNLLSPIEAALAGGGRRLVALDYLAADPARDQPGEWIDVSPRMRLMALASQHSDQVVVEALGVRMPLHLGRGKVRKARHALPRKGSQWAEGTTFAYVLDFLDESGTAVFRVYYQDSGADEGRGAVPARLLPPEPGGKRVDLAILCVGGAFDRLVDHPAAILRNTRPRFVLLSHWEDFFVPQTAYCVDREIQGIPSARPAFLGGLRKSDTQRFLDRVRAAIHELKIDARVWLPCPTQSRFELPLETSAAFPKESVETYDCARFR